MESAAFIKGFGVGFGLIVAIGAQNAYVLTRGVSRNHHWVVAALGSVIDALLITVGILGMGSLVQSNPGLLWLITIAGAVFLFVYGLFAFRRIFTPGHLRARQNQVSLKVAVMTMLSLSLLNPHVYLDTVVLLGSVAIHEAQDNRLVFGAGAVVASFVWFFSLALSGQWMQRCFQSTLTWRILDIVITLVMWSIALTLVSTIW